MEECNAVAVPAIVGQSLGLTTDKEDVGCDATLYRSLVGKLLYASNNVRFDISFIVDVLCRNFSNPKERHWKAAKDVLR
jgi:exonuclease I